MNIGPLIERPESPQTSGDASNRKISRIFNVKNGESWADYIPAKQSLSPDGDGYFLDYNSRPGVGYTIITFNYSSTLEGGGGSYSQSRQDGETDEDLTINLIDKPLEAKGADYRMNWNYDLWGSGTDEAPDEPSWWEDTMNSSDADGVEYTWSKDRPGSAPDPSDSAKKWFLVKARTKPGIESYLVVQPVVRVRRYNKRLTAAKAFLHRSVSRTRVPSNTFGFTGGAWLSFPVGITNDGEWWVAENEYQFGDSWDEDLYT